MNEYHKIQGLFKRDEKTHKFIEHKWTIEEFHYLRNNIWVATEKIDGTNIRIQFFPETEEVCFKGKTDKAQIPVHLLEKLNSMFQSRNLKEVFDKDVCLYGEGCGIKIQKGGKYIPNGVDFILFDIKIGTWFLKREDLESIAKTLNIDIVPIVGEMTLLEGLDIIKRKELKSKWGDFLAEGIVLKPKVDLRRRSGERIVTKIKHEDF